MKDKREHKTKQLCRQVEQCLSLVLAGEMNDQHLDGLMVVDVIPLAGTSILQVDVALPPNKEDLDPMIVLRRLRSATNFLRREVASAIHRKRTPELTFRVSSSDELGPDAFEDDSPLGGDVWD
jgi:ribosome-binding factor A